MIGQSPAFLGMRQRIEKYARYEAPVLIEGETGTGKELAARAIHYLGARRDKPFVPVNCGALPELLIENELFGHRKGAFTDARTDQPGLIAHAHGGTLFLDEIDALSPKAQVTLLRFLQDQHYRPLGERREQSADVRLIAASNANLTTLAERGQFRLDLLYRLKILHLELPPLRHRKGDPEVLAHHFVRLSAERYAKPRKPFHPDTLTWFDYYAWPGNVRELENVVYRAFLLAEEPAIYIPPDGAIAATGVSLDDRPHGGFDSFKYTHAKAQALAHFDKEFLIRLLAKANGNVTRAAQLAGTERRYLGKLLKKYGIDKNQHFC